MQFLQRSSHIAQYLADAWRTFQNEGRNAEYAFVQGWTLLCIYARSRDKVYFLNMKKIILILLIFCAFNNNVNAKDEGGETYPKFTFGLEWGYIASLSTIYHYNFYAPEGFRVDEKGMSMGWKSSADVYMNVGWNINPVWNLSFYIGYAGVGNLHNALPVSLRGTRYFRADQTKDCWFVFADTGSGICLKTPVQEILSAKIGGGYRMALSRDTKLDFLFSVRSTYTHPSVYYDDSRIPLSRTNRNNAVVSAVSIGLGLRF